MTITAEAKLPSLKSRRVSVLSKSLWSLFFPKWDEVNDFEMEASLSQNGAA